MKRTVIILVVLCLAIAAAPLSSCSDADATVVCAEAAPSPTPFSMLPAQSQAPAPTPRPTLPPAESYARITVGYYEYLYPLNEEMDLPIRQADGCENILHIGKNRVCMASSTCEDKLCVGQGEVTLENREDRILYNMIVCLPNAVMVELLTAEEAEAYWNQ